MRKAIPKKYMPKTGIDGAAISHKIWQRDYVRKHLGITRRSALSRMRRTWRRKLKQQLPEEAYEYEEA